MGLRQRFTKGASTANLVYYPPGGPAQGTIQSTLKTTAGATLVTLTGSVLGINTTATANASKGERTLTVADATQTEHRQRIWVGTRVGGPLEQAEVLSASGTTITLVEPLRYDHSNPGVRGAGIKVDISSHVAANGTFFAEWSWQYEALGTTEYATQLWDVVSHRFQLPVTAKDLRPQIPQAVRFGAGETILEDVIQAAEDKLIVELRRANMEPDLIRDADHFKTAGILASNLILLERFVQLDGRATEAADRISARFREEWQRVLDTRLAWYDGDSSGTLDAGEDGVIQRTYLHELEVR